MKLLDRFTRWLETHWVNPAYSGWLLGGLALFFFAAATNTMAGWLYVISAVMVAILALAALLPVQTLRGIRCQRAAIQPVSVGEALVLELVVKNQTAHAKPLIQVLDELPAPLTPIRTAIEQIPPQDSYRWGWSYRLSSGASIAGKPYSSGRLLLWDCFGAAAVKPSRPRQLFTQPCCC